MPRGVVPRQPARTGKQDKVRTGQTTGGKNARLTRGKTSAAAPAGRKRPATAAAPVPRVKGYNPLAPERVTEILNRLDQRYPAVTCALTHSSAW